MAEKQKNKIGITLLIIGALFIAYGIFRGEVDTVFTKAVQICMECVGIG